MTKKAKHTPGPWKLLAVPGKENAGGSYSVPHSKVVADGLEAFTIYDGLDMPVIEAEREANARLIAAAPELLEALVGILEAENFYSLIDSAEYKGALMPGYGMNFKKRLDAGRAAIAKAWGQ